VLQVSDWHQRTVALPCIRYKAPYVGESVHICLWLHYVAYREFISTIELSCWVVKPPVILCRLKCLLRRNFAKYFYNGDGCGNDDNDNNKEYHRLGLEIYRMWHLKRFVIPIIIGTSETVNKELKHILKHCRESIQ